MKFDISLRDFHQALQKVSLALPKKSPLPTLEYFYFIVEGDLLKIIATDQKIIIMNQLVIAPNEDGKILVPGKKIMDIIRALEDNEELTFSANNETFNISIKTIYGKYSMKGLNPNEYLDLPELFQTKKPDITKLLENLSSNAEKEAALISKKDITWASERTYFCASKDEFRVAMTGVYFEFLRDKLNLVSTDGYRLSKATIFSDGHNVFPDNLSIIIPADAVELLRKADDDVLVSFIKNEGEITHIRFDIGDSVIITRRIAETFPKYENVIPTDNPYKLKLNKKEIVSALRRVSLFASSFQKMVKFKISSESMVLSTEDPDQGTQAQETVPCEFNNENFEIAFNYEFFIEAVQNIETEENSNEVFIEMSGSNKPAIIRMREGDERLLMLLMPMRIN